MADIPPMLNYKAPVTWDQYFVCPIQPLYQDHHGHHHRQYIDVSDNQQAHTVGPSIRTRLKANRKRVYGTQLVTKPAGPVRKILAIRDYRFPGNFDKAAFQLLVGEPAPCSPFPAQRTAQFVRLPEGVFSLDELQI